MSLREALEYSRRHREPVDPLISVEAMRTGLYGLPGGQAYMEEVRSRLGLEISGGAGVLVSGMEAETKFHLHNMPVLNHVWAIAHLDIETDRIVFSYPDREGCLPGRKRYVFFDTASLEKAGIPCCNVDGVQSLASLLMRIEQLPVAKRGHIRSKLVHGDSRRYHL